MTRFLATGDLHVGVRDLDDHERILDQIVTVAHDRDIETVLIAGDVFHRPKPTPAELHVFARFARKLEHAQIQTVAVVGDVGHDQVNGDEPCALELFASDWMRVSRTPEVIKAAGDVAVATLPAVAVHRLVAARGGRDDASEVATAMLLEIAGELFRETPSGWPTVLLAHHAVLGASLPNGLPVAEFAKPMLPVDALDRLGFDAVVLGDIHRAQLLGEEGTVTPIFYVGSPGCWDFGEAGYDHGCWILDTDDLVGTPTFVELTDRRFVTVDVDLTEMHAGGDFIETDFIAEAVDVTEIPDAVVRIRYRCTEEQARRVDVQALKGFLAEAGVHRVHQIVPDIVRTSRARAQSVGEGLDPMQAVDAYLAAKSIDGDRAAALRSYAAEVLEQVTA